MTKTTLDNVRLYRSFVGSQEFWDLVEINPETQEVEFVVAIDQPAARFLLACGMEKLPD